MRDWKPLFVSYGFGTKEIGSPLAAVMFLDDWHGRRGVEFEAAHQACSATLRSKADPAAARAAFLRWAKASGIHLPEFERFKVRAPLPARPGAGGRLEAPG